MNSALKRYRIEVKGNNECPDWFAQYLWVAKLKASFRTLVLLGTYDVQIRDMKTGRYMSEDINPPCDPNCGA